MAKVLLKDLNKHYDGTHAVKDVNLEIHDHEFVVLVGPSGCGKTTTLRMVAGLEDITSGEISIDGKVVNDLGPMDRDIAMVFQNYAMSRSIGARSFTTLPSMLISPEVMSSRPATMRSVVVLPQPDGPTSTTNSWSWISRFTSLTAWVPS